MPRLGDASELDAGSMAGPRVRGARMKQNSNQPLPLGECSMKKVLFVVVALACACAIVSSASAQDASKNILSAGVLQINRADERTPEQMDAFDATTVAPEKREVPFHPTINESVYRQMKQMASLAPHSARPGVAPEAPLAPVIKKNFNGATECDGPGGCWVPPDVAGAVGTSQFVSVSNNVFEVRSKATGALLKTNSLNGLCGYSAQAEFDPRVLYDEEWQRWVITAPAFPNSSTEQEFCLAVSQTNNATGKFWVFVFNVEVITGASGFYDYPMLGMNQDYLILTANSFPVPSSLFAVPKARVYNGFGFSVPFFTNLVPTLEPGRTIGLDTNAWAWLASAPSGSGVVDLYAYNPGTGILNGPHTVTVNAYGVPPGAAQPAACSGPLLDTLDNRFQNVGVQNGDTYYQVHTTNDFGLSTPRYYIITGLLSFAPVLNTQADFFASGSSYDFNPGIMAQPNGVFAIDWSVTDPAAGQDASVYYRNSSTGVAKLFTGGCYATGSSGTARWGDYSQTTADPGTKTPSSFNTNLFWIDNEYAAGVSTWSTRIGELQ